MYQEILKSAFWEMLIILYKLCVTEINLSASPQSSEAGKRKQKKTERAC